MTISAFSDGKGAGSNPSTLEATDITGVNFREPFYLSTFPQCYALAATTVTAYTLFLMLFITPRSFLDGGVQVLGRRAGFTGGHSSSSSIGGRPWLQKVAALTVVVSLTIASVETFHEAQFQHDWGVGNANTIQRLVNNSILLKAIRIASSTFLWLAQAQTLLRLFRRQREKVIIKWTAACLIVLDIIFDSLNSFLYSSTTNCRPSHFTDAIPALNYLFQLALGLLYSAWVIYYAFGRRKYAFYHDQMPNMMLVAFLSLLAIFVPVAFFILDISKPEYAGWGDYVRWVGAAAASVIVWEWVERIEALEREDKKGGILGREVLEDDDMLDDTVVPKRRFFGGHGGPDGSVGVVRQKIRPMPGIMERMLSRLGAIRIKRSTVGLTSQRIAGPTGSQSTAAEEGNAHQNFELPLWPTRPAHSRVASKVSAADLHPSTSQPTNAAESGSALPFEPPLWPQRPAPAMFASTTSGSQTKTHGPRVHSASITTSPTPQLVIHNSPSIPSTGGPSPFPSQASHTSQPWPTSPSPDPSAAPWTRRNGHQNFPSPYTTTSTTSDPGSRSCPPRAHYTPRSPPQAAMLGQRVNMRYFSPSNSTSAGDGPILPPSAIMRSVSHAHSLTHTVSPGLPSSMTPPTTGKRKLREYASSKADKLKSKLRPSPDGTSHLPTVIIPPPSGPAIETHEMQMKIEELIHLEQQAQSQQQQHNQQVASQPHFSVVQLESSPYGDSDDDVEALATAPPEEFFDDGLDPEADQAQLTSLLPPAHDKPPDHGLSTGPAAFEQPNSLVVKAADGRDDGGTGG